MSFGRYMILLSLAIISPHAISAEIPKTEEACIAAGGNWIIIGFPCPDKTRVCDMKAPDYGKECSDSDECVRQRTLFVNKKSMELAPNTF